MAGYRPPEAIEVVATLLQGTGQQVSACAQATVRVSIGLKVDNSALDVVKTNCEHSLDPCSVARAKAIGMEIEARMKPWPY
jgi:hypothetical protein